MAKIKTKLTRRTENAAGTMSFFFEKPPGFIYKSGQNADYTLIDPAETDSAGNTRTFSFASAPHEPEIEIATRMRDSAFKRTLKEMPLGSPILIEGPLGSMTLHNDTTRPAVMIAGGIGVTPFVSMVRHATHHQSTHRIYLFYANRTPGDAAYLRELIDLQNENHNYRLVPTMTGADEEMWDGEVGRINEMMLRKYLNDDLSTIFYLAGSPVMANEMRALLNSMGVDDDYIKSEEFSGY